LVTAHAAAVANKRVEAAVHPSFSWADDVAIESSV
jgi:hypothetical protein